MRKLGLLFGFAALVASQALATASSAWAATSTSVMNGAQLLRTATQTQTVSAAAADIEAGVYEAFARGQRPDVLVHFRGEADLSFADTLRSRTDRATFVYNTLSSFADSVQAEARSVLQASGRQESYLNDPNGYMTLWISNSIAVKELHLEELTTLASTENVSSISLQRHIPLPDTEVVPDFSGGPRAVEASIAVINAPDVWAMGYKGAGIVLGGIDSGVRHTHAALVNQYRGNTGGGNFDHNYNWYDPYQFSTVPRSTHPHGNHTTGTSVGDDGGTNQIGVAPEAKWIHCIGFGNPGAGATNAGLLACGQFMAAPTTVTNTNPDPTRAPHSVNNSWGDCGQSYDTWYEGPINAWIANGTVPVFSNGNNSNCGYAVNPPLNTVGNPGRSGKVLGVGSTGNNNSLYAMHSNKGPTDNASPGLPTYPDHFGFARTKPNVVAPGVAVRSASNTSDTAYYLSNGTSMSAPAVNGLVGLMWDAAPCLIGDYPTTGTIIMETADRIPVATGSPLDGPGNIPNQATGWGQIDALAAVNAAIDACDTGGGGGPVTHIDEDFQDGFPAGWSTSGTGTTSCPWLVPHTGYSMSGLNAPSLGAGADADECGVSGMPAGGINTSLVTPTMDLSGATEASLTFDVAYRHLGTSSLNLEVSTNGGTSWTSLRTWTASTSSTPISPVPVTQDLSAYAGQSSVTLRWRYVAGWDWWAFVDNVVVTSTGGGGGGDPDISVTPASLSASQAPDTTTTQDLTIANTGTAPLTWTVVEAAPTFSPDAADRAGSAERRLSAVPSQLSARNFGVFPMADVIQDGGFEGGSPNAAWDEFSATFGTVLCTVAGCGTGTGTGPHSGTWWAWFGGIDALETGFARQDVVLAEGTAELSFWLEVPSTSGLNADFLSVSIDGDEIFRVTGDAASAYLTYQQVVIDVSEYADGGTHTLSFDSTVVGGTGISTNFMVDDVMLDSQSGGGGPAACTAPSNIPWASVSPASGTTPGGGSSTVTVTYDSTGLSAGTYDGLLCVTSNDPDEALVEVPVSLTVTGGGGGDVEYSVSPTSLAASQAAGTTTQQTLTLTNSGTQTGNFTIVESTAGGGAIKQSLLGGPTELYNNGPMITHPGGGAGGADASALEDGVMTTFGAGAQQSAGNRVADDFVVPASGWTIDTMTFYSYQTGSTTTSTITGVNVRIWDGVPGAAGSNVVFGDTTTNVMSSTSWTNIYRTTTATLTDTARPIMAVVANIGGLSLAGGTYWVDYQFNGTLASGPWAPPVTILGQTSTGNSLQFTTTAGAWAPLVDGLSLGGLGLPFVITGEGEGGGGGCQATNVPWLSVSPTSGTTPAGGTSDVTVTFDSTGLTAGVYNATLCVQSNDTVGNEEIEVPVSLTVTGGGGPFPAPYCPVSVANDIEPITRVIFGSINNTSPATVNGVPAHENFTTVMTDVTAGATLEMRVESNTAGNFTHHIRAFFDWNDDGDFTDAGESYVIGTITNSTGTDGQQAIGNVAVPATATDGPVRMRVIAQYNASPTNPCGPLTWGQAEDYTVNVTGGVEPGDPIIDVTPEALSLTAAVGGSDSDDLSITNIGQGVLTWSITESEPAQELLDIASSVSSRSAVSVSGEFSGGTSLRDIELALAPRGGVPMSQTTNTTIAASNSVACSGGENRLMRRFYFNEHAGVANPASINSVDVAIQEAAGTSSLTVNLYTIPASTPVDTIPVGALSLIGSGSVPISPANDGSIVNVPVTGNVGDTSVSNLVVEVVGGVWYIGASNGGQTHPGFIVAPDCGISSPTAINTIGPDFVNTHIIMVVNTGEGVEPGVCDVPSSIPWLSASPASGSALPNETDISTITASAVGVAPGTYDALLCVNSNDPVNPVVVVPVEFTVEDDNDCIFADGFEGGDGSCGGDGGGGTPGVYTDRATFLQNVSAGYYEEAFSSVVGGPAGPSMSFSGNGFAYTITATGAGTNNLFNDPGLISHDSAVDALVVTFTGAPVTAVGGNFWATDIAVQPTGTTITITLSNGTVETFTSTGPNDFRGFVTESPITSITIDAPDSPVNAWSTLDNLIVGQ